MRRLLLVAIPLSIVSVGCTNTKPDRTMRLPKVEEFAIPPASFDQQTEIPRSEPLLTPKPINNPGLNTNNPNLPGGPQTNGGAPGGRPGR
jgi:hypothetical protein